MSNRSYTALGLIASTLLFAGFASADTTTLSPASCDQLFNLPANTITTAASAQYLNPQTCSAYQYLIARYNPGSCSAVGFTNAKVQGITSLNAQFAQNLAKMLQAAGVAGFNITINSAFRTPQGETCANPNGFGGNGSASMHAKGLAADLQYPNDPNSAKGCDSGQGSAGYQWVAANASKFGIGLYDQLHSRVSGECNHVEASTAVAGGVGPGGGGASTPTQPISAPGLLTSSPTTGLQAPPGYCMTSTQPIIYTPCNSNPAQQASQPTQVAQPAVTSAQPVQQTAGTTPTVTPTSQLTPTASSPASSAFSNLLQPAPFSLPPTAPSATQALNIMTNLGSYATSGSPLLNQSLNTIINNLIPGNTTATVQASNPNTQPIAPVQDTFSSNPAQYAQAQTYTPQFDQILGSIKNVLLGILSYLRSL